MKISARGLKFLMENEGTLLHVYKDSAGYPTIGVGHLIRKGEDFSKGLTTSEAMDLLANDLVRFEEVVNKYVTVPLTQNQYDTLVSFAFNVGDGAFRQSTLLAKLNLGFYEDIPVQLMRWTKAGGKKNNGLVARRQHEIELWTA